MNHHKEFQWSTLWDKTSHENHLNQTSWSSHQELFLQYRIINRDENVLSITTQIRKQNHRPLLYQWHIAIELQVLSHHRTDSQSVLEIGNPAAVETAICWHFRSSFALVNNASSGHSPLTGNRSCLPPARAGKQGWRGTVTARTNWPADTARPTFIGSGCRERLTSTAVLRPSPTYRCCSQVNSIPFCFSITIRWISV